MTVHSAPVLSPEITSQQTPEHVLRAIVDGINTGDLDALMRLYQPQAAFAAQPGNSPTVYPACVNRWPHSPA